MKRETEHLGLWQPISNLWAEDQEDIREPNSDRRILGNDETNSDTAVTSVFNLNLFNTCRARMKEDAKCVPI